MDELVETYKELDDDFYDDLTDILIMADVGMPTAQLAVGRLREKCTSEKTRQSRQGEGSAEGAFWWTS